MAIRRGPPEGGGTFDVCVVGSGPAGLAVALACGGRGHSVIVLEAGGDGTAPSATHPVHVLDDATHARLDVATREGFGGTSSAWGGLCVPYDPIDFAERPWLPESGWPLSYEEASAWHAKAGQFLDCGTTFMDDRPAPVTTANLDVGQFGRLARRAALATVHRAALANSRHVTVCLGATVESVACDPTATHVVGVDVGGGHGSTRILARHVVLAAGGLRTTRLLLALARAWPRHFAAGRAPLGKYYMGHLTGEIATLAFRDKREALAFLYAREADGHWAQRRLKLAARQLKAARLPGAAFTLRAPWPGDHSHGDGALSMIALLASLPGVDRLVDSERLREAVTDLSRGSRLPHLRNVLSRPASTVRSFAAMWARSRVENLPIIVPNASGRYSLRYHAEQIANPDSRVSLDENDSSRLVVDFRYTLDDFDSVVRSHDLLDEELRAAGIGHLEYRVDPDRRHDAVRAQSRDGYHQIGTTRMSVDPATGVVDPDCRVHGFENLYVASASTFPTSGSANPTLHVVVMALRLADHISALMEKTGPVTVLSTAARSQRA